MISKHFIFDFDGVIYDGTDYSIQRLINAAIMAGAKPPSKKFLIQQWGKGIAEMAEAMKQEYGWQETHKNLFLHYETEDKSTAPGIPGLDIMLQDLLEQGHRVSIISNRRHNTMLSVMESIELNPDIFNAIYALNPDGSGLQKPNPAVFDLLIKSMHPPINGLGKKDTVFIGDTVEYDYYFAKKLGLQFVGIASILYSREDFIAAGVLPHMILNSVIELPQILEFV